MPMNVSIENGMACLPDGSMVDLMQIQSALNGAFQETGDREYMVACDEISKLTHSHQGPSGEFLPGSYCDNVKSEANANSSWNESRIEVLQHQVLWFLRGDNAPTELDECSVERITALIAAGYNSGELCVTGDDDELEYRGWWRIETH